MTLEQSITIFESIKANSSRTTKESILSFNKSNEQFLKMAHFLYNPFILTGLSSKKIKKKVKLADTLDFNDIEEVMEYLEKNPSGRDFDIAVVQGFINKHDTDTKKFLQSFFTKSYKCGITSKTLNKVYGSNFIPEFDVMLAESYFKHEDSLVSSFFITKKLDGVRCLIIKTESNVLMFSRQGKPINGLVEIEEEILNNIPSNTVIDGELLKINTDNLSSDELYRETTSLVNSDGIKTGVKFHVFDSLPFNEFLQGKSKLIYFNRRSKTEQLFSDVEYKHIELLPVLYYGEDKEVILELLDKVVAEGEEGLMVNASNGFYVTKRTKNLLKVKKMQTADLRVVGMEEGQGALLGTLGKIVVDWKGHKVGVGSGFTLEERHKFWNNPDSIIGHIAEIQYFEESKNKQGGISLRFPVFKWIRTDKNEVSYE